MTGTEPGLTEQKTRNRGVAQFGRAHGSADLSPPLSPNRVSRQPSIVPKIPGGAMSLNDRFQQFIQFKSAVQNVSPSTIRTYKETVPHFLRSLDGQAAITRDDIISYIVELDQRGLSPRSKCKFLNSISAFCRFLVGQALLSENPCQGVPRPKIAEEQQRYATEEEVKRLLQAAESQGPYLAARDSSILLLMAHGGLRRHEVENLALKDVHADRLEVLGKGGRQRRVPFSTDLQRAIWKWRDFRDNEPGPFLQTTRGKPLKRGTIEAVLAKLSKISGVSPPMAAHALRRYCGSKLGASTSNYVAAARIMGHSLKVFMQSYVYDLAGPTAELAKGAFG